MATSHDDATTTAVAKQYELLPYAERSPSDGVGQLICTWLNGLCIVNHHLFGGRQTFANGFQALVADGGTGDSTIFLAERMRGFDAEVVHLVP